MERLMQRMSGLPNENIRIASEEAGMHAKSCLGEKSANGGDENFPPGHMPGSSGLEEDLQGCIYDKTSCEDQVWGP